MILEQCNTCGYLSTDYYSLVSRNKLLLWYLRMEQWCMQKHKFVRLIWICNEFVFSPILVLSFTCSSLCRRFWNILEFRWYEAYNLLCCLPLWIIYSKFFFYFRLYRIFQILLKNYGINLLKYILGIKTICTFNTLYHSLN